mmetsp:Transcript_13378/g.28440  ORF Transcript_13378/g.28440 Transcript_13378/m.28440 type:complete len:287 (-) Transcript_13378:315-1175(-)
MSERDPSRSSQRARARGRADCAASRGCCASGEKSAAAGSTATTWLALHAGRSSTPRVESIPSPHAAFNSATSSVEMASLRTDRRCTNGLPLVSAIMKYAAPSGPMLTSPASPSLAVAGTGWQLTVPSKATRHVYRLAPSAPPALDTSKSPFLGSTATPFGCSWNFSTSPVVLTNTGGLCERSTRAIMSAPVSHRKLDLKSWAMPPRDAPANSSAPMLGRLSLLSVLNTHTLSAPLTYSRSPTTSNPRYSASQNPKSSATTWPSGETADRKPFLDPDALPLCVIYLS